MRIGVKFCGGCNPRYDRNAAYQTILKCFEPADPRSPSSVGDAVFEYAEDGASYDVLLCFGGCANDCAATDGYDFGKLVSVRGPAGTQRAVDELTGFAADMAKSDHATGGQEP